VVAGRRWGKTRLAIITLIYKAVSKKTKVWLIAPTYKQAEMIAWKLLQELIPPTSIAKKNEVKLSLELDNGSEICLKGADNEDSLRGVGLDYCVLDEYAQMKPNVWHEIVRPMLTDTKGGALFIGTPQGKNALWELYTKGQREEDGFRSWTFRTVDNPYIDSEEIEQAKKELPERYFRQEYEASFEDYIGLIYPEFNKEHVIEPFYIPNMYPRVATIDPALSGTTAVLKAAVNEDGDLIIYDEFYEQNKRASEVAESVKEENVTWYIDPSAAKPEMQREGKLYSFHDEYSEAGIHTLPAESDIEAGINRMGEWFKRNKIKIFKTCKNLIWELERYHWSEERETVSGMVKPKPYKKDDHLCDCLRYLVMSRQDKARFKEEPINPNSPWGRMMAKQGQSGQFKYGRA
jgi:PBSX family phage terminase large subunit